MREAQQHGQVRRTRVVQTGIISAPRQRVGVLDGWPMHPAEFGMPYRAALALVGLP
jgi:hypothetical protein